MTGAEMIAEKLRTNREHKGYTLEHDMELNTCGELIEAAECYLYAARTGQLHPPRGWPFEPSTWKPSDDPIRNLVHAGALLAAEIDRRQQEAQK